MTPHQLGEQLLGFCEEQVRLAGDSYAPGLRLPRVFGGHEVDFDTQADFAFLLGLLWQAGHREVGGQSVAEALRAVLLSIDGALTHSFYSYRIAETLRRFGTFDDNSLIRACTAQERLSLVRACGSDGWIDSVRRRTVPRHHAAVLARVELGRLRLGLTGDEGTFAELLGETQALFAAGSTCIDDSQSGVGRFDIYSADLLVFSEPLAPWLGARWTTRLSSILELLRKTAGRDGAAFVWGRSTGLLGVALTVEMAALALGHRQTEHPGVWLALAINAAGRIREWFKGGIVDAHQYKSCDSYRGPRRRLQLTFDTLAKLAWAGFQLRDSSPLSPAPAKDAFPERDELLWFDDQRRGGLWSYRSPDLDFVLPITGCASSDYVAWPRRPGLFETPTASGQLSGVPVAVVAGRRYTAGGLPCSVEKFPGGITLRSEGWIPVGGLEKGPEDPTVPGSRVVTYKVTGRVLALEDQMNFGEMPQAVSIQVAEARHRPLEVSFGDGPGERRSSVIDTSGMCEWRSFWGELPRVHELDLQPRHTLSVNWSISPRLRVLSSYARHAYHRRLYDEIRDQVVEGDVPTALLRDMADLPAFLRNWDVFHLHWPELFLGPDATRHRRFIQALRQVELPIVWTQHNLTPHDKTAGVAAFQEWAAVADAAIHHSVWGRGQALQTYRFRAESRHEVIPHPHFGGVVTLERARARAEVEAALGLRAGVLRVAVLGAPRHEKLVDLVIRAVKACRRTDLEVLIFCADVDGSPFDDERLRLYRYQKVPRPEYDRRLAALDVVLLPFANEGMLTTGTVADVVGAGLPAVVSDWPFLLEYLGPAGICYGRTVQDLTACLDHLDAAKLAVAAAASRELQSMYAPARLAAGTLALLREVSRRRAPA